MPVFFFISGFLISASWERHPDLRSYFRNRFLRIFPAYWAALLLSLAGILLFYRALDPIHNAGRLGLRALSQLVMLSDWNPNFLRGYGDGVANGSLWTIPIELCFYLCIPALYWLLRRVRNPTWVLAAVIILSFAVQYGLVVSGGGVRGHVTLFKLIALTPLPWLGMFCVGILAQRNITRLLPLVAGRVWLFGTLYAAVAIATAFLNFPRSCWARTASWESSISPCSVS